MDNLIPTVRIAIKPSAYRVLEATINPLFPTRFGLLRPRRQFEIWIELVVGHDSEEELPLPSVTIQFSGAFDRSDSRFLPLASDVEDQRGDNREVYHHFWFNCAKGDLLSEAFGKNSCRLLPKDDSVIHRDIQKKLRALEEQTRVERQSTIKAAYAFRRADYQSGESYKRINYPATFTGESQDGQVNLVPRLFNLADWLYTTDQYRLSSGECFSFWYKYPYSEVTASYADDKAHELISFIHRFDFGSGDDRSARLNMFPRLPFRYDLVYSRPEFVMSPRLAADPPQWQEGKNPMYPMVPAQVLHGSSATARLVGGEKPIEIFLTLMDRRLQQHKAHFTIYLVLACGGLISVMLALWTDDLPEFIGSYKALATLALAFALFACAFFILLINEISLAEKCYRSYRKMRGA